MVKAEETRRQKARQMRYKKPIATDLNLSAIRDYLYEIQNECDNIRYYMETDEETLINALDGDEEEAYEFRMMFCDLDAECDRMLEDLDDYNHSGHEDIFDLFFVAVGAGSDWGGLMGYDEYEEDYYGLDDFDQSWVEGEAAKKLERMAKRDLIETARWCYRVYQGFIGLKYRYDCLKASMDILNDKNLGHIQMVKRIEELYEKAEADSSGFKYNWHDSVTELDKVVNAMPAETWVQ